MLAVVLLLLTVFSSGSHEQCLTDKDYVGYYTTAELYTWIKSRLHFDISLLKAINDENKNKNIVFSPWSIQESLLLAYFGARRETETSIAKTLQIPARQTKALTWRFYNSEKKDYVDEELSGSNVLMKSANKIFVSKKLSLRPCMVAKFENELESIDYERDSAVWAKNYINGWVESVTEGQIKDLIKVLSPKSSATLVNAVLFKSKWEDEFNSTKTLLNPFFVNEHISKPVKMMVKKAVFRHGYSKTLGARMVLLPYEGNRVAMIVLLPDKNLDKMMTSLNVITLGIVTDISMYRPNSFELVIPKYDHKSSINLDKPLRRLGIGKTLTGSADFSGFTGKREVFFTNVVHEAKIKMDEEGTTAVAATRVIAGPISLNTLDFRCDRPFAYIIYDFVAGKVLFMGTFRNPEP